MTTIVASTEIVPGTIACIGLCRQKQPHRHELMTIYEPAPRMLEATLQEIVVSLVGKFPPLEAHWWPDSRLSQSGWPDLTIIGGREIWFRELKMLHMRPSAAQRRVAVKLARAGGNWRVWTPGDLYRGAIELGLSWLAAPPEGDRP